MKTKISYTIILCFILASACNDAFLDRNPLGQLSTVGALSTPEEMGKYLNQFYEVAFVPQPGGVLSLGNAYDDQYSDNMAPRNSTPRIAGTSSLSGAIQLTQYNWIRNVNFMIANFGNTKGDENLKRNYQGEAYFFRAWFYFDLVKKYGNITWINKVLPPDQELMKVQRDSRILVVDSILADLDRASILLQPKTNSASMRIHRDVALAFKSRVALYEGTWQKYHKAKNTAFYTQGVDDSKIQNYLGQARDAAKTIIDKGVWSPHTTGKPLTDYQLLFITYDLSSNKEVLWWKKYSIKDNYVHGASRYMRDGGGDFGLCQSLIDDYLTRDGRIFTGTERENAQKIYANELKPDVRDPRLAQTVATPGVRMKDLSFDNPYYLAFPPINLSGWQGNITGFSMLKFVEINNTYSLMDESPAIQFRYGEVLLNYAEALAELNGDQAEIAKVLKPLRDRVNMPGVDFNREYNSDPAYPFSSLNKSIQVVRRERRIELALEGFRMDDIFRWAAADLLIIGKRPLGALFTGSNMEAANGQGGFYNKTLFYDNMTGGTINLYLTGKAGDEKRYIDPYQKVLPNGWGFKTNRDYLLPIQERMLTLTGNQWVQNPGW